MGSLGILGALMDIPEECVSGYRVFRIFRGFEQNPGRNSLLIGAPAGRAVSYGQKSIR